MKDKDIKRIAKKIYKNFKAEHDNEKKNYSDGKMLVGDWCEYDAEVSDKFKKMLVQLLDYGDNLRINLSNESLSISVSDVTQLRSNNKSNKVLNEDNYLELSILKNTGFSLSKGYNKTSRYKDKGMFIEMESTIKDKLELMNKENFNDIWNNIMVDSGLIRDNNLLDILDDK